ncbi:MAG: toxin glutamine deamidase domain-containing protein [Anaerolineae bacterium]
MLSELVRPEQEAAQLQADRDAEARTYYLSTLWEASDAGLIDGDMLEWQSLDTGFLRGEADQAATLLENDDPNTRCHINFLEDEAAIYDVDIWRTARQARSAALLVLSFVPIVGTLVDVIEAYQTVKDWQDGKISGEEAAFHLALSLIGPFGDAASVIRRLADSGDVAADVVRRAHRSSIEGEEIYRAYIALGENNQPLLELDNALNEFDNLIIGMPEEYWSDLNWHPHGHGHSIRQVNPQFTPPIKGDPDSLTPWNTNCLSCVVATDDILQGRNRFAQADPVRDASSYSTQRHLQSELLQRYGENWLQITSYDEIRRLLNEAGPGASGIVMITRPLDMDGNLIPGHVFNAINQRGTVRFLDGQIGGAANLESSVTGIYFLWTNQP